VGSSPGGRLHGQTMEARATSFKARSGGVAPHRRDYSTSGRQAATPVALGGSVSRSDDLLKPRLAVSTQREGNQMVRLTPALRCKGVK